MRTIKALACAAALAAGLATAVAQSNVYSLNVVGYYNVTVPQGQLYIIANQLNTTNNQIQYIINHPVDYTQVYKYNNGYTGNQYLDPNGPNFGNGWDIPDMTMNPGEAMMIKDPNTPGGQTLTFVGEVLQGQLSNNLLTGPNSALNLCFRSSMVPQAATLNDLGIPGEDYDTVYWYVNGYQTSTFTSPANFGNGWDYDASGNGPVINVGQGFGYKKAGQPNQAVSSAWVRNFTVE